MRPVLFVAGVLAAVLMPAVARGTTTNIMHLGDSITYGRPVGELDTPGLGNTTGTYGYRVEFQEQFIDAGFPIDGVSIGLSGNKMDGPQYLTNGVSPFDPVHQGTSGDKIFDVFNDIDNGTISLAVVDIVVLHIGTNDITSGAESQVTDALDDLDDLVELIFTENPDVHLVLAQIIPRVGTGQANWLRTTQYSDQIPDIAAVANHAGQITLVDMDAAFGSPQFEDFAFFTDDVHPNLAGYQIIGEQFAGAVLGLITPEPTTILLLGLGSLALLRRRR